MQMRKTIQKLLHKHHSNDSQQPHQQPVDAGELQMEPTVVVRQGTTQSLASQAAAEVNHGVSNSQVR